MITETQYRNEIARLKAKIVELTQSQLPMSVESMIPTQKEIEHGLVAARREGYCAGFKRASRVPNPGLADAQFALWEKQRNTP